MKKTFYNLIIIGFITVSAASTANAQPGSLDPTFGTGGKVTTSIFGSFTGYDDRAESIAIQSDGKIVVAGHTTVFSSPGDIALVRYDNTGSLDSTFGSGGIVITTIGTFGGSEGRAVAIQSDGKIVVAGSWDLGANADFAVVRYNTNGSLDNTFGIGGKVTTAISGWGEEGKAVIIQSDGKIVVAGKCRNFNNNYYFDFAVVRYNIDGSLDMTFGIGGKVTTTIGTGWGDSEGKSVALQSDGKIVVAGYVEISGDPHFVLVRYNSNGTLDYSFGFNGHVLTANVGTAWESANAVALQTDGKILAAGYANGPGWNFASVRYNTNSSIDSSFGSNGKVITDVGTGLDEANAIIIQNDGKIILAGVGVIPGQWGDFALVRYNNDGSLDSTFGTAGKVTTDFAITDDIVTSIAIQGDGKIVAAGGSADGFLVANFSVARYNGDAVGIAENITEKNTLNIFPNPTTGSIQLTFNTKHNGAVSCEIMNVMGERVYASPAPLTPKGESARMEIDVSFLAKGIYVVRVGDGERWENRKLVVE